MKNRSLKEHPDPGRRGEEMVSQGRTAGRPECEKKAWITLRKNDGQEFHAYYYTPERRGGKALLLFRGKKGRHDGNAEKETKALAR